MTQPEFIAACHRCGEAVFSKADACPSCGYSVEHHDRRRLGFGFVGTVLTLSVVFAPLGIPMLWAAHRHRRYAEGTVTGPSQSSLVDHLLTVFSPDLDRPFVTDRTPDFTRGGSDHRNS